MEPAQFPDTAGQSNSFLIGVWKIIGGRSDWQGNCRIGTWHDEILRFDHQNKFSWQVRNQEACGEYNIYHDNRIIMKLDTIVEGTYKFLDQDQLLIHFEEKMTILKMMRIDSQP